MVPIRLRAVAARGQTDAVTGASCARLGARRTPEGNRLKRNLRWAWKKRAPAP